MSSSVPIATPRRRIGKAARRSQLLACAEAIFGEVGYAGATMELIAKRAGVARSLLYEHFNSLDDLYVECARSARGELDRRLLQASAAHEGNPHDQLRAGITAYFRFVEERGAGWEVLFGGGPAPTGPIGKATAEMRFRTADQIAALFSIAVPDLDAEEARAYAHAVSGAGEQLARWWRRNPRVPLEIVVDRLMTVAWEGLRGFVEPARPAPGSR